MKPTIMRIILTVTIILLTTTISVDAKTNTRQLHKNRFSGPEKSLIKALPNDNFLYQKLQILKTQQGGNFIKVGADSNCDTTSIKQAIVLATQIGYEEIRVAYNMIYYENIIIHESNVTIRGGFSDCQAAQNNHQENHNAIIDGTNLINSSIIRITGITQKEIILDNLTFTNGNRGAIAIAGIMDNMVISNSSVYNNSITNNNGAGISCIDPNNVTIVGSFIGSNEILKDNNTAYHGGGISMEFGCKIDIYNTNIQINTSTNFGGGIAVLSGSVLHLFGLKSCNNSNNCDYTFLDRNKAVISGGGIYISGNDSHVEGVGVNFIFNKADIGGAVFMDTNTSFILKERIDCYQDNPGLLNQNRLCNNFEYNRARFSTNSLNQTGGAIYNNNGFLKIDNASFNNNRANVGTAIYSTGVLAQNHILSSLFHHNGGNADNVYNDLYVFRAYNGALLTVNYSTIADNQASTAIFGIKNNSRLILTSSIIAELSTGAVLLSELNSTSIQRCLITHESNSITGDYIRVVDPKFVDSTHDNYHLRSDSPAIDYCNDQHNYLDIDQQNRGIDDPRVNNNFTGATFDIGMDEFIDALTDIIFANGFE